MSNPKQYVVVELETGEFIDNKLNECVCLEDATVFTAETLGSSGVLDCGTRAVVRLCYAKDKRIEIVHPLTCCNLVQVNKDGGFLNKQGEFGGLQEAKVSTDRQLLGSLNPYGVVTSIHVQYKQIPEILPNFNESFLKDHKGKRCALMHRNGSFMAIDNGTLQESNEFKDATLFTVEEMHRTLYHSSEDPKDYFWWCLESHVTTKLLSPKQRSDTFVYMTEDGRFMGGYDLPTSKLQDAKTYTEGDLVNTNVTKLITFPMYVVQTVTEQLSRVGSPQYAED